MESILYQKKIALNGDSICAGAGYKGGYGRIIAERNGMICQNLAVGGATLIGDTYYRSGKPRHWISRTICQMDPAADFAIVEGGVNDASLRVPLGQLTQGYDALLDDTTFYGAFESMLKQLTFRFAGKKVGYIAVHKMTAEFSSEGDVESNYYHAARRCCNKWGVAFCDLNISCPPFGFFEQNSDLFELRQTYTKDGDGWHPNELGYRAYYCDQIEAWLKTL